MPQGIEVYKGTDASWPLTISYIKVDMNDPRVSLKAHAFEGSFKNVRDFCAQEGAKVAINGGFFGGGANYSAVIEPTGVTAKNIAAVTRDGLSYKVTRGLFTVDKSRNMSVDWVYHFGNNASDIYAYALPTPNAVGTPAPAPVQADGTPLNDLYTGIGGGPVLVKNGSTYITYTNEVIFGSGVSYSNVDPRSAIGYTNDGYIILLSADGRLGNSVGLSLPQLAQVMKDLGCVEALNLDGGGSAQMATGSSYINNPSEQYRSVGSIMAVHHTPIEAPVTIAPAADAQDVPGPVMLEWMMPYATGSDFRLQVATSLSGWNETNGFTASTGSSANIPVNVGTGQATTYLWSDSSYGSPYNGPVIGQTYYWSVRAYRPDLGVSTYSSPKMFKVGIPMPVAVISEDAVEALVDQAISLDGLASYITNGQIVNYAWDMGDGTTLSGSNVSHQYTQTGTYTIALTVTDDQGNTNTASITADIVDCIAPSNPEIILDDSQASLSGAWYSSSSTPGYVGTGYIHDGATSQNDWSATFTPSIATTGEYEVFVFYTAGSNRATNTPVSVKHAYGTNTVYVNQQLNNLSWVSVGTYVMGTGSNNEVIISNEGANQVVIVDAVKLEFRECASIAPQAPQAIINSSTQSSQVNTSITFDASASSDVDGSITAYAWDFGDGATANTANATHTYTNTGTYTVSLTVTDNDNQTATTTQNIEITDITPTVTLTHPAMTAIGDPCVFTGTATPGITRVEVTVDTWPLANETVVNGLYSFTYTFNGLGSGRNVVATAYNANNDIVATSASTLDVVNQYVTIDAPAQMQTNNTVTFSGTGSGQITRVVVRVDTWQVADVSVSNGTYSFPISLNTAGNNREVIAYGYDQNNNLIDTDTTYVTVSSSNNRTTLMEEQQALLIYPVPVRTTLYLQHLPQEKGNVVIRDITGKKVGSKLFKGESLQMDVKHLHKGLYILEVDRQYIGKFVKM
ncbi:hypothetical protein GCM10023331_30830 [Algivirga pacifica]|uniref:PKD domain-containing protein n=2 Tax=Algivirga pacifica TaxID=1162670 RepID=A0ABP9DHJ3_9BACT